MVGESKLLKDIDGIAEISIQIIEYVNLYLD